MAREPLTDRVDFNSNTVVFRGRVSPRVLSHLQVFINEYPWNTYEQIVLDFSRCTKAYPNTMVPLVASVQAILAKGVKADCVLPSDENLRSLFLKSNWAYFLAPARYHISEGSHDKHLATRQFKNSKEQQDVVNEFIDVTMRTLEIQRSFLSGLEWSINELTDNVINHAESVNGGFVQLASYPLNQTIAFCVADAGRGILNSLREAYPGLRRDTDAIADAVRGGVTRNKDFGQGNGLSGSLRIAIGSRGRFAVTSGLGNVIWEATKQPMIAAVDRNKRYRGTFVDVQIPLGKGIDLSAILGTHATSARPIDSIDLKYLSADATTLQVRMSEETVGFGSRHSGQQMRTKVKNLMAGEPTCPVVLDWASVPLISSSYADEFLGKLFVELGPLGFMQRIRNMNMTTEIEALINKAIVQRTQQEQIMGREEDIRPSADKDAAH
jgi:anti-sigma regulatory factor (Ser/Thr protein kinase)